MRMRTANPKAGTGAVMAAAALMVVAAVLVQACPAAREALEFDRRAVAGGQVWRLVTSHLTHWSWVHLAWDMGSLVALCWIVRRRGCLVLMVAAAASVAIGLAVYALAPDIGAYRGMSGVNYALLGWALLEPNPGPGRRLRLARLALLAMTVANVIHEWAASASLLWVQLPDGVAVVAAAHAAGLAVGVLAALAEIATERFLRRPARRDIVRAPRRSPRSATQYVTVTNERKKP